MKTNFLPAFFLILIVAVSGCTSPPGPVQQQPEGLAPLAPTENSQIENQIEPSGNSAVQAENFLVEITESGYDPATLTVKKGSTVTWTNLTNTQNWPATAQHPTHQKYPGSDILKCGTEQAQNIFDACKGLEEGKSFSFTFSEVGEWPYHDHLGVKMFGKIIVTE